MTAGWSACGRRRPAPTWRPTSACRSPNVSAPPITRAKRSFARHPTRSRTDLDPIASLVIEANPPCALQYLSGPGDHLALAFCFVRDFQDIYRAEAQYPCTGTIGRASCRERVGQYG